MKCFGAMLTVVSFAAVVWSHCTMPSISHLRESMTGCCLSGLCPLCMEYVIKCRLFYKELTCN